MRYIEVMAVVDSGDDLLKVAQSFRGRKPPVFADIVEELPAFDVLQNQIKLGRGLPDVVKPHDVRVLDEFHDDDLPFDALKDSFVVLGETIQRQAGVDESIFRDDFNGSVLFGLRMPGNSDPAFTGFNRESFSRTRWTNQNCPFQSSDRSSRDQSCLGRGSSAAGGN